MPCRGKSVQSIRLAQSSRPLQHRVKPRAIVKRQPIRHLVFGLPPHSKADIVKPFDRQRPLGNALCRLMGIYKLMSLLSSLVGRA